MKALARKILPRRIYDLLHGYMYRKQRVTRIKCGAYEIQSPANHQLIALLKSQPYRHLCVGVVAKYVSEKYPGGSIVDIGANIGDTAAIIATHSRNKLILIEASDYYFDFLVRNVSQLSNEVVVKKSMISNGRNLVGFLSHQGGTAYFDEGARGKTQVKTERLSDVADENTCFVKTDTDGYDFEILIDSLEWLGKKHPAIILENQISNGKDLDTANELYARLRQIGYEYFIVWDDPGCHLVSTTSLDVLKDLNRYLLKVSQRDGRKSIYNYDVLCLHRNDEDIYNIVRGWCTSY